MMKKSFYKVPASKKVRIIVDSDAACECDDQYAIMSTDTFGKSGGRNI